MRKTVPFMLCVLAMPFFGCTPAESTDGSGGEATTGAGGSSGQGGDATTATETGGAGGCEVVDDGNECTEDACAGSAPVPKADGTHCADNLSRCLQGACQPFEMVGLQLEACDVGSISVFYPGSSEHGDAAPTRLNFDQNGVVSSVRLGFVIGGQLCQATDKTVYLTELVADGIPMSPAVHEAITIPVLLLEKGEPFPTGDSLPVGYKLVRVHRPLMNPLQATAGKHAFLIFDMESGTCVGGSYAYAGASPDKPPVPVPSGEDFWCTNGAGDNPPFTDCGAMDGPPPGISEPFKWAGEVSVIPSAP